MDDCDHDYEELLRADRTHREHAVLWCHRCGAVRVDSIVAGRVFAGLVRPERRPSRPNPTTPATPRG